MYSKGKSDATKMIIARVRERHHFQGHGQVVEKVGSPSGVSCRGYFVAHKHWHGDHVEPGLSCGPGGLRQATKTQYSPGLTD